MATKHIMMVGVFDVKGSTNIAMAEGFRSLGHSVEEFNYRTRANAIGVENMEREYLSLVEGRKFDLQVFCKVNGMNASILDYAKKWGPTWYWFMDNFATCRMMNAANYATMATFASATASDVAERFSMINKNAYHIFEGYNPKVYYYEDLPKIHDFLFVGNATVNRIEVLNALIGQGHNISIFGYGWPIGMNTNGPVFDEDEACEINSAGVVLNLCHDDVIFSDRVTKALACGANVLSQSCKDIKEMVKWFTNNPNHQKDIQDTDAKWIGITNQWDNRCDLKAAGTFMFTVHEKTDEYMQSHHSWQAVCADMLEKASIE